jgi:hypothetical protein
MKVYELLEELSDMPHDADVYVWVDGERYPMTMVDDSFLDQGFVELNAFTGGI